MYLKIISKLDGFRRAGIAHSLEEKVYEKKRFTKEQIEKLKAEPMLIVREVRNKQNEDVVVKEEKAPAMKEEKEPVEKNK
ncbi:hypothetical protein AB834_00480 [PVC group bacterium (ex Bugula neritina AB1)]|nr:hypothetical protein AB834_00480 [PVC group bacterium (ex Bugula neritina AB1)]